MVKTKQEIKNIVKQYISNLKDIKIPVSKIILYGSYNIGHPKSYSDIDLAVISPYFKNIDPFDRLVVLGRARVNIKVPLELMGYSLDEYRNSQKGTFLDEIKKTGKIIYSSSNTSKRLG